MRFPNVFRGRLVYIKGHGKYKPGKRFHGKLFNRETFSGFISTMTFSVYESSRGNVRKPHHVTKRLSKGPEALPLDVGGFPMMPMVSDITVDIPQKYI